jgi:hypothetical protein
LKALGFVLDFNGYSIEAGINKHSEGMGHQDAEKRPFGWCRIEQVWAAYSSSTHRFPDERTPIEATPLSATSAELGLGLGLGLGLDSLSHSSSHALPFFSPPSFHTLSLFPAFTSVWWSG